MGEDTSPVLIIVGHQLHSFYHVRDEIFNNLVATFVPHYGDESQNSHSSLLFMRWDTLEEIPILVPGLIY